MNTQNIQPLKGILNCYLWENESIGLPLSLYYAIVLPLKPFDSGHNYVEQPTQTEIVVEWIVFSDDSLAGQEKNWKSLMGRKFVLSAENGRGEGSVFLGLEHLNVDCEIEFLSLEGSTFEVELKVAIDFQGDTTLTDTSDRITFRTQLEFDGLRIFHRQLPSYQQAQNPLILLNHLIDLKSYASEITRFEQSGVDWLHLRPRL